MPPRPIARRLARPRFLCTALAAVVALFAAALLAPAPSSAAAADDMVGSQWIGLGYNQNPQPPNGTTWSVADWSLMTTRTDYIKPRIVRVMFNLPWYWTGTDSGGTYDFTTDAYASAEKVVKHYVDEGVPVISGLFGIGSLTYTAPNTAAVQAALVKHLQDDGAAPRYWIGVNEPNVDTPANQYTDWVTATGNLAAAFGTAGVDTGRTTLSGPDTAEAGISSYGGDLSRQTVSCSGGGQCPASLVWKLAGLDSFTAQVYSDTATDTAVTFQGSADGTTWRDVAVPAPTPVAMVTGKNEGDEWRYDYTASSSTGAKYLRLSVAASPNEHSVGSMSVSNASTTLLDPLDDLTRTQTALDTGTWKSPDWWLNAAHGGLVGASEAHFYSQELWGAAPEYVEPVMTQAVPELRAAAPAAPVLLGETGMKAPQDGDSKDYGFALDTTQPLRMADLAVQEARGGVDGTAAWCLDGYASTTYCGMWGRGSDDPSKVAPHSTALRPWFYTWSLLCRYLPTGSVIHAPAEPAGVRVLAAQLSPSGWTFVLVNRTSTVQSVPLTEPTGTVTLNKYVYTDGSAPAVDAAGFPVPVATLTTDFTSGHTLTVGPNSVALFTTAP